MKKTILLLLLGAGACFGQVHPANFAIDTNQAAAQAEMDKWKREGDAFWAKEKAVDDKLDALWLDIAMQKGEPFFRDLGPSTLIEQYWILKRACFERSLAWMGAVLDRVWETNSPQCGPWRTNDFVRWFRPAPAQVDVPAIHFLGPVVTNYLPEVYLGYSNGWENARGKVDWVDWNTVKILRPVVTLVTNTVASDNHQDEKTTLPTFWVSDLIPGHPDTPGDGGRTPFIAATERYETTTVTRRTVVRLESYGEAKEVVWEKVISSTRRTFKLRTVEEEGKPVDVLKEQSEAAKNRDRGFLMTKYINGTPFVFIITNDPDLNFNP